MIYNECRALSKLSHFSQQSLLGYFTKVGQRFNSRLFKEYKLDIFYHENFLPHEYDELKK